MSNKNIIEEKVEAIMQEMYAVDEPNMTDEQVDRIARSILTKALTEVAAHQQARNIEAVEKIAIILYDARITPNEKPNIRHALDKEDVLTALRSQHLS